MEITTDIQGINKVLKEFKGEKAQLWLYDITHKKIAIRISINNQDSVVYLIIANCKYIQGVFSWDNPNLSIEQYSDEKKLENVYKLIDYDNDFKLEGTAGVSLAKGLESEFGISFDNFLL